VEEVPARGVQTSGFYVSHKICHEFFVKFLYYFVNSYSHAMSCTPCTKAKAACKPFDTDKTHTKTRVEAVWRSKARKTKQQMDMEWKVEVSRKLEDLSKLWGLRKDIWRIAVAVKEHSRVA